MAYIIKDTNNKCWLLIDRIVRDIDIVTTAEPVYNYKAATKFNDKLLAEKIIEQIKSEGNYDVSGYMTENTEDLEKKEEEQEQPKEEVDVEKLRKIAKAKLDEALKEYKDKGLSEEEILKELSGGILISPEEIKIEED